MQNSTYAEQKIHLFLPCVRLTLYLISPVGSYGALHPSVRKAAEVVEASSKKSLGDMETHLKCELPVRVG